MKVLKQVDTSSWGYRVTCNKCDSELMVESSDLRHLHHEGYDMSEPAWDEYFASCPICSNIVGVPESKIPKALQVSVKSKSSSVGNR